MLTTNVHDTLLPLNLQFFASEGDGAAEAAKAAETGHEQDGQNGGANAEENLAAPADLNALLTGDKALQSQYDKLVSKALETAQAKWKQEQDMTAEQLAEAKAKEKAEVLAGREQAVLARELRAEAITTLVEKGLDTSLIDCVSLTDGETMKASVVKMEKAFRAAVDAAVKEKLKGSPPKTGGTDTHMDEFQKRIDKYRRA